VDCTAVEQCGRNLVVQSRRLGISKPAHYFRSKCLREDYLYSDTCQDYRYFTSQMFEAFPGQIPTFSEKTFRCLILSQVIVRDNTRTDLWIGLFPSGMSSKRSFAGL